jgi:hypothetical protein
MLEFFSSEDLTALSLQYTANTFSNHRISANFRGPITVHGDHVFFQDGLVMYGTRFVHAPEPIVDLCSTCNGVLVGLGASGELYYILCPPIRNDMAFIELEDERNRSGFKVPHKIARLTISLYKDMIGGYTHQGKLVQIDLMSARGYRLDRLQDE